VPVKNVKIVYNMKRLESGIERREREKEREKRVKEQIGDEEE
jgi:hypothetical protein